VTRYQWAYELMMAVLAILGICLAILPDSASTHQASLAIWAIFLADYTVNFLRSRARGAYVRENIPELIAVLPWDFLRGMRLLRLLRLMRVLRGFAMLWRVHCAVQGVLRTNGLGYVLGVTATIVVIGGIVAHEVEPSITSIGDGIWWSLVTTSTVGYGDIAPKTLAGRATAAVLMLVGIGTLGMITAGIATYFLGVRTAANPHIEHVQRQLERWEELSPTQRRELARVLETLSRDD
jgi:voltage-gated potassium channel